MFMYVSQSGGYTWTYTYKYIYMTYTCSEQSETYLWAVESKTELVSISKMACVSSPMLDNKIYNLINYRRKLGNSG